MRTALILNELLIVSKTTFTDDEKWQIVVIFIAVILLVIVVCCLVGLWIWWVNKKMGQAGEYTMNKIKFRKTQKEQQRKEEVDEKGNEEI